ncbi:30S ribosomal protein S16 [Candidatus Dependentiae bacterium]
MSVKIRLSRIGKKKAPCYRIVAVDSRKKRDGACLENLGTYDALSGVIVKLHQERIDYWISQGAKPTDTVKKLIKLSKNPELASEEVPAKLKKSKPKAEAKSEKETKPEKETKTEPEA